MQPIDADTARAAHEAERWAETPSGASMLYRRFGRAGLDMPVFSTGGMRFQHGWKDLPFEEIPEEAQRSLEGTIRRSLDAGINHIETARGYGPSERQLGRILPRLERDALIVQTKVPPNEDPGAFRGEFEDSLARLALGHVDLLSFHGINDAQTLDHARRCLPVARSLVDEGLVRWVGFSTHGSLDEILDAVRVEDHGGFDYFNVHWYYILQRNWQAIAEARRRDMGVFIISPTDKGGRLQEPPERLRELTAPLSPMAFNDLFCLSHPEVHTLSLGAAKPSDYDEHLLALESYDRREDLLPPIIERLERAVHDRFGRGLAAMAFDGVPDWKDTPGGVNLQVIIWLVVLAESFGLEEYGRMRYGLLGRGGHWFPGMGLEEADFARLEEALSPAPHRKQLMEILGRAHALLWREPAKRLSESD